jgi:signal transduction histidine kinase
VGAAVVTRGTLFELLRTRREELLSCWMDRTRGAVGSASLPRAELLDRMPAFVDEITAALYPGALPLPPSSGSAEEHGEQRLRLGFDVAEVIREYGLLHECILALARAVELTVGAPEQEVIARWLNNGIADAIAQYVRQRDVELQRQTSEHLGFIAHELRNPLSVARLALQRLRQHELAGGGRAVELLDRNLRRAAEMIDSTLNEAALKMGLEPRASTIDLGAFLREVEADAASEAQARQVAVVISVPEGLTLEADPRLLRSALSNLLHNALKFSHEGSAVTVSADSSEGWVTVDVADACGGLPPGRAEELFAPLVQRDKNRSGYGLGLAIAQQAARAHDATIRVRDIPGTGCVFTLALPHRR